MNLDVNQRRLAKGLHRFLDFTYELIYDFDLILSLNVQRLQLTLNEAANGSVVLE